MAAQQDSSILSTHLPHGEWVSLSDTISSYFLYDEWVLLSITVSYFAPAKIIGLSSLDALGRSLDPMETLSYEKVSRESQVTSSNEELPLLVIFTLTKTCFQFSESRIRDLEWASWISTIMEPPQAPPQPFRFLDLPREIRHIVYEYSLVIDGEIVPYPSDHEKPRIAKYKKPTVGLLGTCHQIRDEAHEYLYRHNLWRISFPNQLESDVPITFWDDNLPYFRHVTVSFDHRDLTPDSSATIHNLVPYANTSKDQAKRQARLAFLHEYALRMIYETKLDMVLDMLVDGNLISVRLDFTELMHPCCRSKAWKMLQTIESFRQMNRYIVLQASDKVPDPARQAFKQNLVTNPARVRKSREPVVYVLFSGLRENEFYELKYHELLGRQSKCTEATHREHKLRQA
ncbi:MAG: hypothetical protein Q9221_008588 [Calogaya cf. arnoldii]